MTKKTKRRRRTILALTLTPTILLLIATWQMFSSETLSFAGKLIFVPLGAVSTLFLAILSWVAFVSDYKEEADGMISVNLELDR